MRGEKNEIRWAVLTLAVQTIGTATAAVLLINTIATNRSIWLGVSCMCAVSFGISQVDKTAYRLHLLRQKSRRGR